jgi:hypothetical protein
LSFRRTPTTRLPPKALATAPLRPSRFLSPLIPRRTDAREDVLAGPIRSEQDPSPLRLTSLRQLHSCDPLSCHLISGQAKRGTDVLSSVVSSSCEDPISGIRRCGRNGEDRPMVEVEWGRGLGVGLPTRRCRRETNCIRRRQSRVLGGFPLYLLNRAASSEPPVTSPALYECAPAPARWPPATIRYSSRMGRPSNQHSRISRTPAA